MATKKGRFYVKRDGSTIPTITVDGDADSFVQGLARYIAGGKIGFIDEYGNIVIKAAFEWAYPFNKKGYAVVIGSGAKRAYEREVPGGDPPHSWFTGGVWGCIDKKGKIIIPVIYSGAEVSKKMEQMGIGGIGLVFDEML